MTSTLPISLEAFTPEWLTMALRSRGVIGDAAVAAVRAEPIGAGAGILCRLARLTLTYDRPVPAAPRTLVAKYPTPEPATRHMVGMFRFYEREVRFYDEIAGRAGIATPRPFYSAYDPATGDFVLLIEDLATRRLGDQLAGASADDAGIVAGELANLHAVWWESPRLAGLNWLPSANAEVNRAGLSLYPVAWPVFMERFGHALPASIRAIGEQLGGAVNAILGRFSTGPLTVCHGDSRQDNFFFAVAPDDPPLTVIDWQIGIRARGTYDIGYFASQSLPVETRRSIERDVLARYVTALKAGGVHGYDLDHCIEDYRWMLLFCFVYPVIGGGLGDLANERGHALSRTMMERAATAILDWDAGALLNRL